jgi:anthranilate phosphoribosyltransferase
VRLWTAGAADDIKHGIALARESLLKGKLAAWLEKAQEFYGA